MSNRIFHGATLVFALLGSTYGYEALRESLANPDMPQYYAGSLFGVVMMAVMAGCSTWVALHKT